MRRWTCLLTIRSLAKSGLPWKSCTSFWRKFTKSWALTSLTSSILSADCTYLLTQDGDDYKQQVSISKSDWIWVQGDQGQRWKHVQDDGSNYAKLMCMSLKSSLYLFWCKTTIIDQESIGVIRLKDIQILMARTVFGVRTLLMLNPTM